MPTDHRGAPTDHRAAEAVPTGEPVGTVGEFELVDRITADLPAGDPAGEAVRLGPGDDAAVVAVAGDATVISTDALVAGVHFRTDWSSATDVGRKSVAVNVSDIEAMGARPTAIVVALALPASTPSSWLAEFSAGVRAECVTAGVALVGGDLTRADEIVIVVTAIGDLAGRAPVTRSGARPGDVVAIRGRLGWSGAGFAALSRGFRSPRAAVDAHRVPTVPYGQGRIAAEAGATAMIDVSDGLINDLGHLAERSGVRVELATDRLEIADPVRAVAQATGKDPLALVLAGGEDYALAACFPQGRVPAGWAVVGSVAAGDPAVLTDGRIWDGEGGWDHFGRG